MKKQLKRIMTAIVCVLLALTYAACAEDAFAGHLMLKSKDIGPCRELTGDIPLVVVFVELPDALWSEADMQSAREKIDQGAAALEKEAADYGMQLDLVQEYHTAFAQEPARMADCLAWNDRLLAASQELAARVRNHETMEYYHNIPVIYCLNTGGRAFAQCGYSDLQAEYLVLFSDFDAFTVRHELLHLFGAQDYYSEQETAGIAEMYYSGSTMLEHGGEGIDSLTAYIVGWTDELDAAASGFLQATAHITEDTLTEASDANQFNGYTVRHEENFTYAGMVEEGQFHGWGIIRWKDGNTYQGEWLWGERTGFGRMDWADGVVYTGEFVSGKYHGKGTLVWADGTTYTGGFDNGQLHGCGVYAWQGGTVYAGGFDHGAFTGKGVLSYENGDVYEGDFVNLQYHGKGKMTYSDGKVKEGRWENNTYIGE